METVASHSGRPHPANTHNPHLPPGASLRPPTPSQTPSSPPDWQASARASLISVTTPCAALLTTYSPPASSEGSPSSPPPVPLAPTTPSLRAAAAAAACSLAPPPKRLRLAAEPALGVVEALPGRCCGTPITTVSWAAVAEASSSRAAWMNLHGGKGKGNIIMWKWKT